tara:strand:- start:1931 stop:2350 length:420 start_codon:yes stop_codon:yes gene_type:complete
MEYRKLTTSFFVSSQIKITDIKVLKSLGFTDIICNRPPNESSTDEKPDLISKAANQNGINFHNNPFPGNQLSTESISRQKVDGTKTIAYCTSGARSAILWAFSVAGDITTENILQCLSDAGFPMPHLADQIEAFGQINT